MASEWTDELKQQVIDDYVSRNPTPENSIEIVKELAEEYDKTANGIRMILSKAEVYVKKAASTKSTSSDKKTTRVSKADAQASLTSAIEAAGLEVDEDIISKLTGKAANYFHKLITSFSENGD